MHECHHILVNGSKCKGCALRGQPWCYFHNPDYRKPAPKQRTSRIIPALLWNPSGHAIQSKPSRSRPLTPLQLPLVEGRPSVNLALSQVIQALANGAIETGRARLLLYTLEIASRNFRAEALYRANTSTAGLTA